MNKSQKGGAAAGGGPGRPRPSGERVQLTGVYEVQQTLVRTGNKKLLIVDDSSDVVNVSGAPASKRESSSGGCC